MSHYYNQQQQHHHQQPPYPYNPRPYHHHYHHHHNNNNNSTSGSGGNPSNRSIKNNEYFINASHNTNSNNNRYPYNTAFHDRYEYFGRFDYPPPPPQTGFSYNMLEPMPRDYDDGRSYFYDGYGDYDGRMDDGFMMGSGGGNGGGNGSGGGGGGGNGGGGGGARGSSMPGGGGGGGPGGGADDREVEYERYMESCGGWRELRDTEGRPYYYNMHNGASQWEKPMELRQRVVVTGRNVDKIVNEQI